MKGEIKMGFFEYLYTRPDMNELEVNINNLLEEFNQSKSPSHQIEVVKKINILRNNFETMKTIVEIRYSLNTEDKYYNDENTYMDEVSPIYEKIVDKYYKNLLSSKFRSQLVEAFGTQIFNIAACKLKTFSEDIIEDLKIENKLVSEYIKLRSTSDILFDGEKRNIPQMQPFLESDDRDIRIKAQKALNGFFEKNEDKFDEIYDKLVHIRNEIAVKLGFENYIPLGYMRLSRTDYDSKMIESYRNTIMKYVVPYSVKLKERQRKRLGYDKLKYYDEPISFVSGNPTPKGNGEWILEKGKEMYSELSKETEEFFDFMIKNQLLDVFSKKGKAGGGYCTYLGDYKAPFIFSNFNGTSGDIDVLTHEAGHAFQMYLSRNFEFPEYIFPTMEACEIHSMSMEFITWTWMNKFFKEDTEKYKFDHLNSALLFLPYGTLVDEFQHKIYENPNLTAIERKKIWRELEIKYMPHIDYDDSNFLKRGGYWFRQGHIFGNPFYYIDYVLAQFSAMEIWVKMNIYKEDVWYDYINLCKEGGNKSYFDLLKVGNLSNPFFEEKFEEVLVNIFNFMDGIDDSKF